MNYPISSIIVIINKPSIVRCSHIPHAELKIFPQCGHAIAVDAHDKYIKAIKRFLRK